MQSPANTQFELSEIGQIAAAVYDLARAITFYKDALDNEVSLPGAAWTWVFRLWGPRLSSKGART